MTPTQIDRIITGHGIPDKGKQIRLIETHISWVLVAETHVYKIKKPLRFDFLDFSSLSNRHFFCRREVLLNRRLCEGVYLSATPVKAVGKDIRIGGDEGEIIDYAVVMKRLKDRLYMPDMLARNEVTARHMQRLAQVLAPFHQQARVLDQMDPLASLHHAFNDLRKLHPFLAVQGLSGMDKAVSDAIALSDAFLHQHAGLLCRRVSEGWMRDVHGDLHSGNIFLYDAPVVFDCIEFNDELRQIDLLNELAFMCMDLEFAGKPELAGAFLSAYQAIQPCIRNEEEAGLFLYYKMYRANVRAKVQLLSALQERGLNPREQAIELARRYISLMQRYAEQLSAGYVHVR